MQLPQKQLADNYYPGKIYLHEILFPTHLNRNMNSSHFLLPLFTHLQTLHKVIRLLQSMGASASAYPSYIHLEELRLLM